MTDSRVGSGGGAHGAAVKGLRLLTLQKGPDGFGFHMYTNKERDGQYIKNVAENSPADLAGMLTGDHVLAVDGKSVQGESHHQVVERVRQGKGEKKILVIDIETEDEMQQRGEQINTDDAIVMIPRVPPPPPLEDERKDLELGSIEAARPKKSRRAKEMIKSGRSWADSVQAYNDL